MIQWIAFKALLKKSYIWVKTYWYVPLSLLYAFITWFFFRQKASMMIDNLRETRKAHKKEVDIINKAKEEEVKNITEKIDVHLERTKEAEKRFNIRSEDISKRTDERAEELRKLDNEVLAKELRKMVSRRKK